MNIIALINYDPLPCAKFTVTTPIVKGDTQLKVDSTETLTVGTKLILGTVNSATAQIVSVGSLIDSNTVGITPAAKYSYGEDLIITATLFDKFKVYTGTSANLSVHASLATLDMVVIRNTTIYIDTNIAHDQATFYSYTYFNSANSNESNRMPVISSGLDTDITPQYLRENYLYGLDLTQDDGQPLPEGVYWEGIRAAFGWLESRLNIDILPKTYTDEVSDFNREEYLQWVFLRTKHFPVQSVTRVLGAYYGNDIEFPVDWVRLKPKAGIINLVPGASTFAQFLIPSSGGILPILNNTLTYIPGFWRISYKTGFNVGEVPFDIKDIICKKAAFVPLNILGDLVGGIGIASKSIGIDGLSQTINTTNSPENAGYSARLRMYTKEIDKDIKTLQTHYSPISFIGA